MEILTLSQYRKRVSGSFFEKCFQKLISQDTLDDNEINCLLKVAIILINYGDIHLTKLGYSVLIEYSTRFSDYKPLYDFAINAGYYPISKYIEDNWNGFDTSLKDTFFNTFLSAYQEIYKHNNVYISNGQNIIIKQSEQSDTHFALIAPTSYGKSEIMINKITSHLDLTICVIVPTKALLTQTKQRLLAKSSQKQLPRIITHPEMYREDDTKFIAILTQERLLRLLQKNSALSFDLILIDEAHNLFGEKEDDLRAILLAQTLMILQKRNSNVIFNFFSPFIADSNHLAIKKLNYSIDRIYSNEFIKVERFYTCDITSKDNYLKIFDQFKNDFIKLSSCFNSEIALINKRCADKNIIYLNKPRDVEDCAKRLAISVQKDVDNGDCSEIINSIGDYLHPEYNLITYIKKGIVYHHGGMPELIRMYVESVYSQNKAIKYIVTTSTLLEGVNIPAERMFILCAKKGLHRLSKAQFKNLIGRINRFSEIFDREKGGLHLLLPQIYIVKSKYSDKRVNVEKFISDKAKVEIIIEDVVNNLYLKSDDELDDNQKNKLSKSLNYLENIEPNSANIEAPVYVSSEIAQLCYKNNIYDFDIKANENTLNNNFYYYNKDLFREKIDTPDMLLYAIYRIFLYEIEISNDNLRRLINDSARHFYSMILSWRCTSASYKEMISNFLKYWSGLKGEKQIIFIGNKWGEQKRNPNDILSLYVDLRKKDRKQRINLAILKIKEEQDFIEFTLLKYIEILSDLNLIDPAFYDKIKYGTSNKRIICLLKNGVSLELAKIIESSTYSQYVHINAENDTMVINKSIIKALEENSINKMLIFEIKYHIERNNN